MSTAIRTAAVSILVLTASAAVAHGRELTFADRVAAQGAIERVYYSHQIGAENSFEEAVPRDLLERKVVKYLKQSAALEEFWHTRVTAEMLEREAERIARATRMPERLRELYAALGDDGFLVQECLVRPLLVARLARSFFATDASVHGSAAQVDVVANSPGAQVERSERLSWTEWWTREASGFDGSRVGAVAPGDAALPAVEAGEGSGGAPCLPDDTWTSSSLSDFPDGRRDHTAVWTGTEMLVWGGRSAAEFQETYLRSGARYDPSTDSWTPMSKVNAPAGRIEHVAVWTGSRMIVWGGRDGPTSFDTGGQYEPVTDSWTPTSTVDAPEHRHVHVGVWTGAELVVWGGVGAGHHITGGRYDPANDSWTPTSLTNAPTWRALATAVWTGGEMIVWGGRFGVTPIFHGKRYNPVSDTWASMTNNNGPAARFKHTAVWTGSRMIVWGGEGSNESMLASGGLYDPATDSWMATSTTDAPTARRDHVAVWSGDRMLVWGGFGGVAPVAGGGRYDPTGDTWAPISTVSAPLAREAHAAVWTGDRMLVWGGTDGRVMLDTGGRYDASSDSWTPTAVTDAPTGRDLPAAVWTGNRMVIWGGYDGISNDYVGTGGCYDPVMDSWTLTSDLDAPSARAFHSAVWTGSRMVIWGGYDGDNSLNTGGRYDPTTDSWTATSTTDAPSPRYRQTAVWSGSQMLVWGGLGSGNTYFNTGGRYDPASDSWTMTSLVNAPERRAVHTAIWTGSQMVVWGGLYYDNGWVLLATGGRYDPTTDLWTPTSLTGAPSGRAGHTTVWTGSEMIVWGGESSPGWVDTGGRYDPATDSWTPTSLAAAPQARIAHGAVWTGSRMVVWGGWDDSFLDTGGRYDPVTDDWAPTSFLSAPGARANHSAVWANGQMIVWGGFHHGAYLTSGGMYAFGHSSDDDDDGFTECDGDCNDGNPSIFPGAPELCDGLDNDCNFTVDEEAEPPEIASLTFESVSALSWQPGPPGMGAIHDIARGLLGELPVGSGAAEMCLVSEPGNTTTDIDPPDPGTGHWYLVRGRNDCGTGTYGQQSDTTERMTAVCP